MESKQLKWGLNGGAVPQNPTAMPGKEKERRGHADTAPAGTVPPCSVLTDIAMV